QNPVYTYNAPGTYTVNLTVANDFGEDSLSRSDYITATEPAEFFYINASAGSGGVIIPSGLIEVPAGGTMTFNFTPFTYYQIQNIEVDGVARGVLYRYTFEDVYANHTITAFFKSAASGGGGGGGGGSYVIPTPTPTINATISSGTSATEGSVNETITTVPTTEPPGGMTVETTITTPVPTTTVPPAQPFWAQFPLAWLIPIILVIIILAALAYYYYQKEKGEELFEEE
ncbi:MAG: PKD domain-containing protein, partial [Methanoregulaceae archaeon]|nr:PKD domain-containing protein [Methanoregulaceae archaeon]